MTRITRIAIAAASLAATFPAFAEDAKPLTVEQCINVLGALNSLNFQGQQLNDPAKPDGAKPYKFGPGTRMTIAGDIDALTSVLLRAQKTHQAFVSSLAPLPAADPAKQDAAAMARVDAAQAQNKQAAEDWNGLIAQPCGVAPGRLKEADINVGDNDGQNAFPPTVLGAIFPIIERSK
jgi:hypothetical protein